MSESVTEFQVQVTSIMDLLMKVAVKEITKLFEGRYLSEGMPNTGERENDHHQLTLLSDLRNELESAAARSGERCVCSIGVQVGDEPLSRERTGASPLPSPHIKSRSSSKESTPKTDGSERSPNEKLKKADSDGLRDEAVDLHCTVDLPYKDGKHVNQRHTPEGKQHEKQPFTTADDTMEFDGLFDSLRKTFAWPDLELDQPTVVLEETLCEEKERPAQNKDNVACQKSPLIATVTPDCPIACVATPASSQSTNTTSKSPQSDCESKENVELLSNTLSPDHSKDKQAETVAAAKPVSPLTQKPAHVQLGVRHQDWKLLRPCAVHLINVRLFSGFASQLRSGAAAHKGSVRPKDLRVHQGPHTGRRLCCFKEVRDGLWRVHHNLTPSSATSTPGCSPLICEKCHKTFKRRKLLRRHERFHTGERPYACNLCDKTFTLRKSLRRHLRFHTGERPHLCPHCSKSFRLKDNLKTHLRFHTGERPYACTLCPKRYRILKNLETHQLTH